MDFASTDPAPTIYVTIATMVVIVVAVVALFAGYRHCDGRAFADNTRLRYDRERRPHSA